MRLELRERVIVATRNGDRAGVIREPWFGPFTGRSYVVELDSGGVLIAPEISVRPSSESEG